jgi:RNA polymerase sigma-70 factor (ECF subfamily)
VSLAPSSPDRQEALVTLEPEQPATTGDRRGSRPARGGDAAVAVAAYADRLVRFAWRRLGHREDAEDVVQDVFVRTLADPARRPEESDLGPYLYRAVANACTDRWRWRRRHPTAPWNPGRAEALPSTADGPAEEAQVAEGLQCAEALLAELPAEQAEAIRLRVFDELKVNEIAALLGSSPNTIASRLRYGFQKLRALVAARRE